MTCAVRSVRRMVCLILMLLMLGGCAARTPEDMVEPTVTAPSQPELPALSTEPPSTGATQPPTEETLPPEPEARPSGFLEPGATVASFLRPEALTLFYAVDDALLPGEIAGQDISEAMYSLDGTVLSLLTSRGELWMLGQGELRKLAENVSFAALSLDGSTVIWSNTLGSLSAWELSAGEPVLIGERVTCAAISPDGGSIAYSVANADGSVSAWICVEGESRPFGEELEPFAISDGAALVYALGTDGTLHILDETGAPMGPACPMDPYERAYLSSDHGQILFSGGDGWYLRDRGGQALKISEAAIQGLVLPGGAVTVSCRPGSFTVSTLPAGSIPGHFCLDQEGGLWYMDMDASLSQVSTAVDAGSIWASWDGETVLYRWSDGTLFRAERSSPGSPTILASDVVSFAAGAGGLYCLDGSGKLWYLEDFHDPRAIAEEVTQIGMTWDGHCLCLTREGQLLASSHGSDGALVESGVSAFSTAPTASYIYTGEYGHYTVYCAVEGLTFKLLIEDVL